jgi:iron complex outermembrane receptor protein
LDLGDRLTLTAGARYDHFRRRVDYGPTATGDGPIPAAIQFDAHAAVSPKASATFKVLDGLNAYIAYGAGFSPGFGPIWAFRGRSPNLQPEHADTTEIGLKAFRPDLGLSGAVDVFRLERHDLIELLIEQPSAVSVNAGGQQAEGLEVEGTADLGWLDPGLSLSLGYGYVDSKWTNNRFIDPNTGLFYDFSGRRVQGIPANTGSVTLTRHFDDLGLTLVGWIDLAGNYWYDDQNTIRGGAYALFNTSATWKTPVDGLEIQFTIKNLLDRRTTLVTANNAGPFSAYPGLPRQLFGSVSLQF